MVESWLQGVVNIIAWRESTSSRQGWSYEAIAERVPGLAREHYDLAWAEYQKGLETMRIMENLEPNSPIRWALVGEEPPAPTVEVRASVTMTTGGVSRTFPISAEVSWDTSYGDVWAEIMAALERTKSQYVGMGIEWSEPRIIAPVRYPVGGV